MIMNKTAILDTAISIENTIGDYQIQPRRYYICMCIHFQIVNHVIIVKYQRVSYMYHTCL